MRVAPTAKYVDRSGNSGLSYYSTHSNVPNISKSNFTVITDRVAKIVFAMPSGVTMALGDYVYTNLTLDAEKHLSSKTEKWPLSKSEMHVEEWYIMPGGGQEAEETLNEAVCREVSEELGIAIECKELLFVVEGVHGETFHRVDLIFSCEYIDNMPDAVLHGDTNQVGIGWLDISTLNLQPLYPSKLRRQIMNYYQGKPYKVYLGNEEAGDPECLD